MTSLDGCFFDDNSISEDDNHSGPSLQQKQSQQNGTTCGKWAWDARSLCRSWQKDRGCLLFRQVWRPQSQSIEHHGQRLWRILALGGNFQVAGFKEGWVVLCYTRFKAQIHARSWHRTHPGIFPWWKKGIFKITRNSTQLLIVLKVHEQDKPSASYIKKQFQEDLFRLA